MKYQTCTGISCIDNLSISIYKVRQWTFTQRKTKRIKRKKLRLAKVSWIKLLHQIISLKDLRASISKIWTMILKSMSVDSNLILGSKHNLLREIFQCSIKILRQGTHLRPRKERYHIEIRKVL